MIRLDRDTVALIVLLGGGNVAQALIGQAGAPIDACADRIDRCDQRADQAQSCCTALPELAKICAAR